MDGVITPAPNYSAPSSNKRSRKLIFIIFIVILIGALIFGGKKFLNSKTKKSEIPSVTPTVTSAPSDTPVPAESPTPEASPSPTAKPTVNPVDSATGLDRSALSVEVQNGSGVTGAASKASEALKGLGYKIGSVGNADNSDYQNLTIKVKSEKSNFLPLLKKDLGFSYTIGSSSADLSSSSTSDALVIIGK